MSTLVLVVTFNEVHNIRRLIPAIRLHMPVASIVVVDDDSPDGTGEAVLELGRQDPRVHLITRRGARGYSSATIAGMQHALTGTYDVVATLDADFSHDPADLPRLVAALADADVAIGSRYIGGIRVLNWHVRRLLLSLGANAYIRRITGLRCTDCTSGFRAYRTSALRRAPLARITTTGYAFLPELLFVLRDARVVDVPICFTERREGESKMSGSVIAEAVVRPWVLLLHRGLRRLGIGRSSRR